MSPGRGRLALPPLPGRRAAMPGFIPAMRASIVGGAFDDPDWSWELRWDGYRVQAVVRDGEASFWTADRRDARRLVPELPVRAEWLRDRTAILDGAVAAVARDGVPRFGLLDRWLRARRTTHGTRFGPLGRDVRIVFQVFDLLHVRDHSLVTAPLEERRGLLERLLAPHPLVVLSGRLDGGMAARAAAEQRGFEGLIGKHRRSRYEPGRQTRTWLRVRVHPEHDVVVGGCRRRSDDPTRVDALLVGLHEPGGLRFVGELAVDIDEATEHELSTVMDRWWRPDPPFTWPVRVPGAGWVRPQVVVRAALDRWTPEGLLAGGRFVGIDRVGDPRSVVRERPLPPARAIRSAAVAVRRSEQRRP